MFITFEGIDGSGKSTQARMLVDYLLEYNHKAILTQEPGGTNIGKQIRKILHDKANDNLDPTTELLLYFADRAQHAIEVIYPTIVEQEDTILVCDRYYHSSLAYQGAGRGFPTHILKKLFGLATGSLEPDLIILLDLPVHKALARKHGNENRMDAQSLEFYDAVRTRYMDMYITPQWQVFNADQNRFSLHLNIIQVVNDALRTKS